MFQSLKLFFIFCKIFGLIPIKNICQDDYTRWKITIRSFETYFFLILKLFILFFFVLYLVEDEYKKFHYCLLFVVPVYDLLQLTNIHKILEFFLIARKFEDLRPTFSATTQQSQCFWLFLLIGVVLYNIVIRLIFMKTIILKEVLMRILLVVIMFPGISIPMSFIAICSEFTKKFRILNETCKRTCDSTVVRKIMYCREWKMRKSNLEIGEIRMIHSSLCRASNLFFQLFDFPIALYLFIVVSKTLFKCYLAIVLNEELYDHYLLEYIYDCFLIYFITAKTEYLHDSVIKYFFNFNKFFRN